MIIKSFITHNLLNIPGWHTNRHIVVIESDDWGSIRMPSKEVYQKFLDKGIRADEDPYCKYDCLATADDLFALFEVLTSVKDKNGHHAILTADTVVANPVFDKIRESAFQEYFFEPFTETLQRSPKHVGAFELWKQGMDAGIFRPQFHGREHLNVKKWMRTLQSGEEVTRMSFDLGTFGLTSSVDNRIKNNYMGAFNSGLDEDMPEYDKIITEGQQLFEQLFGYKSESFIATTYTWNPKIEVFLKKNYIRYIQGMVCQRIPLDDDTTFKYKKNNFAGKQASSGLIYLTRNCFFEPAHHPNEEMYSSCLSRVKNAFFWHKPAVISMHRLNVIGSINEANRTNGLRQLSKLLLHIVQLYPDVEFMSSDELGRLISM